MIQLTPFSDKRLDYCCAYCGENMPNTRDHVPSRILLDDPFPENLPVVGCCEKCNNEFSKDEGYFATAIECMIHCTRDTESLSREKIKRTLNKSGKLKEDFAGSFLEEDPVLFPDIVRKLFFRIDRQRFENVIIKLAKGHVKFELSTPIFRPPDVIWFGFVNEMSQEDYDVFFSTDRLEKSPEIGCRAFQKMCFDNRSDGPFNNWIIVQEGRDAYNVSDQWQKITVKIHLSKYFCCYVDWNDLENHQ